jgi:hypothetical protein
MQRHAAAQDATIVVHPLTLLDALLGTILDLRPHDGAYVAAGRLRIRVTPQ